MSLLMIRNDYSKCDVHGHNLCNCPRKFGHNSIFMECLFDVAGSLSEIMVICGIHPCKAKAAVDVIARSFIYFDEVRHRTDTKTRKRISKADFIHDMGRTCLMNRVEAQLSYILTKRAFKAFYHGTNNKDLYKLNMESELRKTCECVWVHAAKRTTQTFANFQDTFYSAQKNYEQKIYRVYKHLYGRIRDRVNGGKYAEKVKKRAEGGCEQQHREEKKQRRHSSANKHINSTKVQNLLDSLQNKSYESNSFKCISSIREKHPNEELTQILSEMHASALTPKFDIDSLMSDITLNVSQRVQKTTTDHYQFDSTKLNNFVSATKKKTDRTKSNTKLPRCNSCNCHQLICDSDVKCHKSKSAFDIDVITQKLDRLKSELRANCNEKAEESDDYDQAKLSSSTTDNNMQSEDKTENTEQEEKKTNVYVKLKEINNDDINDDDKMEPCDSTDYEAASELSDNNNNKDNFIGSETKSKRSPKSNKKNKSKSTEKFPNKKKLSDVYTKSNYIIEELAVGLTAQNDTTEETSDETFDTAMEAQKLPLRSLSDEFNFAMNNKSINISDNFKTVDNNNEDIMMFFN